MTDADWEPACMTPGEWASWLEADRQITEHGRALRPCADCPASWMADQLADGTCNRLDADGRVRAPRGSGTPPTPERLAQWRAASWRRARGIRLLRTPAEVEALALAAASMRSDGRTYADIAREVGVHPDYARSLALRVAS